MKNNVSANNIKQDFCDRISRKEAVVGILGLGYVGLPLVLGYNGIGFSTIGYDINQGLVDDLMAGKSRIGHIADERINTMLKSGKFEATTDFSQIGRSDAVLICVPTPLDPHRQPDLSFIEETGRTIAPFIREGQLIVLESTTYPGTTREILKPILEQGSGLEGDKDFILAFSPEREDPANPDYNTRTIPKVVGSATDDGLEMATALYAALINEVVPVSSPETAEAVKLTENIFRAVNIALVNELKLIYDDMGIDVWEVIDAAKTKPFGFMPFYPGPGLGGHCIPIDPFYLTWKAREYDRNTRFIELAGEINRNMPKHVVAKLSEALSRKQQKAVNGSRILIIGIAYKKNVDDMRESPALELMELLEEQGAAIDYYDPHIAAIPPTREYAHFTGRKSVSWSKEVIASYDAILIATDHKKIDWGFLADNARLIIDTRNAMKGWAESHGEKIVKA